MVPIQIQPTVSLPNFASFGSSMDPSTSLPAHRKVPTIDDIMHHQWRAIIEKSEPNTITGNALLFSDFLESTSTWNQHHIIAFRMLDFNDLPIQCLYPESFCPLIDDSVVTDVKKLFTLSNEEIRHGKLDFAQTGPAFLFYRSLQDCLRTQQKTPSPTQVPIRPQRPPQPQVTSHQYTMSDSSGSSFLPSSGSMNVANTNIASGAKTETVTNFLLINYLYLLGELENAAKEASGNRSILFR